MDFSDDIELDNFVNHQNSNNFANGGIGSKGQLKPTNQKEFEKRFEKYRSYCKCINETKAPTKITFNVLKIKEQRLAYIKQFERDYPDRMLEISPNFKNRSRPAHASDRVERNGKQEVLVISSEDEEPPAKQPMALRIRPLADLIENKDQSKQPISNLVPNPASLTKSTPPQSINNKNETTKYSTQIASNVTTPAPSSSTAPKYAPPNSSQANRPINYQKLKDDERWYQRYCKYCEQIHEMDDAYKKNEANKSSIDSVLRYIANFEQKHPGVMHDKSPNLKKSEKTKLTSDVSGSEGVVANNITTTETISPSVREKQIEVLVSKTRVAKNTEAGKPQNIQKSTPMQPPAYQFSNMQNPHAQQPASNMNNWQMTNTPVQQFYMPQQQNQHQFPMSIQDYRVPPYNYAMHQQQQQQQSTQNSFNISQTFTDFYSSNTTQPTDYTMNNQWPAYWGGNPMNAYDSNVQQQTGNFNPAAHYSNNNPQAPPYVNTKAMPAPGTSSTSTISQTQANDKSKTSSKPKIKVHIVDRIDPLGKLNPAQWSVIHERLLESLIKEINNKSLDDIFMAYNGFEWQNGFLSIECDNKKAVNFLEDSIFDMGPMAEQISIVPALSELHRQIIWLTIPPPLLEKEDILKLLKKQNKKLMSENWSCIRSYIYEGDMKIHLEISPASAVLIKKAGDKIRFGINYISVKYPKL
uniref:DUF4780 domain-containing protein n=1 Tax=Stomoxys calcitrans TaxID=35570 RepID=A0A1I8QDW1_STOCA